MSLTIDHNRNVQLSIWEKQAWLKPTDVLVVGAGVLGLWTAIEIKKRHPRWRVVIAESNALPLGASSRNAGFACFGSAGEVWSDLKRMGTYDAMHLVSERFKGIQKIKGSFDANAIGLKWTGGYECLAPEQTDEVLQALPALNSLLKQSTGIKEVYRHTTNASSLFGLNGFDAVVGNQTEGVLHSGFYLQMLEEMAIELDVEILYGLHIDQESVPLAKGIQVSSGRGDFFAQQIVYTTNAYLSKQFPQLGIKPARGQIVLLKPANSLPWSGAFHAHEGYYYWRNLDGNLLLGGGRHLFLKNEETMRVETSDEVVNHLLTFAENHLLEGKFELVQAWAGLMAFTPNKQPILAEVGDNIWAAACCNGMGVAISPIFAEEVARKITGVE